MEQGSVRRAGRTRAAIVEAFNRLVLQRRMRRIRVADVLAEARVGRSTFYDHFSGAEQLHLAALTRPFGTLADAATGRADVDATKWLLDHFWENRGRARETLTGRSGEQAIRLLTDLVEQRLDGPFALPPRLVAAQIAAATLAPVRAWLLGESASTAEALAEALCRSAASMVAALRPRG